MKNHPVSVYPAETQERHCCMDRTSAKFSHNQDGSRADIYAAEVRAFRVQHAVEEGHCDSRFGLLSIEATRSQARTDDCLVSAHRGLD